MKHLTLTLTALLALGAAACGESEAQLAPAPRPDAGTDEPIAGDCDGDGTPEFVCAACPGAPDCICDDAYCPACPAAPACPDVDLDLECPAHPDCSSWRNGCLEAAGDARTACDAKGSDRSTGKPDKENCGNNDSACELAHLEAQLDCWQQCPAQ